MEFCAFICRHKGRWYNALREIDVIWNADLEKWCPSTDSAIVYTGLSEIYITVYTSVADVTDVPVYTDEATVYKDFTAVSVSGYKELAAVTMTVSD